MTKKKKDILKVGVNFTVAVDGLGNVYCSVNVESANVIDAINTVKMHFEEAVINSATVQALWDDRLPF